MKPRDKWQRECLLDAAGELSARRRQALQAMLKTDPELRAYRQFAENIGPRARLDERQSEWTGFTRERLLAAARCHAPATRHRWRVTVPQPVWTYAAVSLIVLLAGLGWWTLRPPGSALPEQRVAGNGYPAPPFTVVPGDDVDWALWELQQYVDELHEAVEAVTWWVDDGRAEEWARELLYWEDS